MALKGQAIAVGTTDTTLYTCPATIESSVHGLVFSNTTAGALSVTLKLYKQSLGTTVTIGPAKSVAANDTFTWPKPINLNAGDYIIAFASGAGVVALYSSYEGSATPVSVGFTGRGTWSSASTYAVNDVVTYNSNSYLAIQAGTNQTPNTATAYWMVLAAQGAAGAGDVTTNTAQTLTAPKRGEVSVANAGSFNMNLDNNFSCTPTGAVTLTFTNITAGQSGHITLVNGANYTISKAAAVKMATGVLTTLSATGTYQLHYHSPDGTNVYVTASGALS